MKKILTGFITVVVLLVSLTAGSITVSASQGSSASISVSKVSAKAGDKAVVVELALNGKNIAGFQGELTFNQDNLSLIKVEQTNVLSKGLTLFDQDKESGDFKSGAFAYASARGMDSNGTVLKFTFGVSSSSGNAVYALKLEDVEVFDKDRNEVKTSVSDGSITVGSGGTVVDPTSKSPTASDENQPSANPENSSPAESSGESTTPNGEPIPVPGSESGLDDTSTEIGSDNLSDGASESGNNLLLIIIGALVVIAIGCVIAVVLIKRKKNNRRFG